MARANSDHAHARELSVADGFAQLSFLVQGVLQRLASEHDVSVAQTRLLGILRDREPTMKELAALLRLDKSSTTGLVDRAERRGFVIREPSQEDRRSARVRLTNGGRAIVSEVAGRFDAEIRAMLADLPAREQKTLSRLVGRLVVAQASRHGIDLFAELLAPHS